MAKLKIAVTLDGAALVRLDRQVDAGVFPNRSQGIEAAAHTGGQNHCFHNVVFRFLLYVRR